jgi:cold shock protein
VVVEPDVLAQRDQAWEAFWGQRAEELVQLGPDGGVTDALLGDRASTGACLPFRGVPSARSGRLLEPWRRDRLMASGTVKWFDANRGYGFIQPEQGEDVFVHVTALEGSGMESLQEGQTVQFDIQQGQKGLQAANVRSPQADQDTQ